MKVGDRVIYSPKGEDITNSQLEGDIFTVISVGGMKVTLSDGETYRKSDYMVAEEAIDIMKENIELLQQRLQDDKLTKDLKK